jgi:DNA-binding PadR family transcriptional regulator
MSRPLLYMHLDRLEKAGLVSGHLELSDDGKAMKYFELFPFELRVTAGTVISALAADQDQDQDKQGQDKQGQDKQGQDKQGQGKEGQGKEALEMEESKDE